MTRMHQAHTRCLNDIKTCTPLPHSHRHCERTSHNPSELIAQGEAFLLSSSDLCVFSAPKVCPNTIYTYAYMGDNKSNNWVQYHHY